MVAARRSSEDGAAQAGMGIAIGDVERRRRCWTSWSRTSPRTSRRCTPVTAAAFFEDVAARTGVVPATYRPLSWGTAFSDLDSDGDLDLLVANGHIYPQVDRHPELIGTYAQRNLLLENGGAGRRSCSSTSRTPPAPGSRRSSPAAASRRATMTTTATSTCS